jgi:hypothetical protein
MDRRSEPRLLTQTPVRVEAIRGAVTQMEGTAVNTSGRGLCVHVPQALNVGELVRLRTESHHTFALVRFCHPEGGHYSAGLERAGEWRQIPEDGHLPDLAAMPPPRAMPPFDQNLGGARTVALQALFTGKAKRPARPRRSKTAVVVGVAGVLVALAALLGMWRLGSAQAPAATRSVQAAAPATGRRIAIQATGDTFVLACADGHTAVQRLLQAGERAEFLYAEHALLRASDGSATVVTRSAEPLGPMASSAGARAWRFTGDRRQEIAAASVRDCTASFASP